MLCVYQTKRSSGTLFRVLRSVYKIYKLSLHYLNWPGKYCLCGKRKGLKNLLTRKKQKQTVLKVKIMWDIPQYFIYFSVTLMSPRVLIG